jgi:hypothetical protein
MDKRASPEPLSTQGLGHTATIPCATGPWVRLSERHPRVDQQVLVRHREGVGGNVCDVACFVGKQSDGELRWIMADVRLESRQIIDWAEIYDPDEWFPTTMETRNEGVSS